jgi:hypothetical protein
MKTDDFFFLIFLVAKSSQKCFLLAKNVPHSNLCMKANEFNVINLGWDEQSIK